MRHEIVKKHIDKATQHKQLVLDDINREMDMRKSLIESALAIWQGLAQNPSFFSMIADILIPAGYTEMMETLQNIVSTNQLMLDSLHTDLKAARNTPAIFFLPELYATPQTMSMREGISDLQRAQDFVQMVSTKIPFIP